MSLLNKHRRNHDAGFTLLEIVFSLVLLGILTSAVFTGVTYMVQVYRAAMEQSERLPQIDAALNAICAGLRRGESPETLKALTIPGVDSIAISPTNAESELAYPRLYTVTITCTLIAGSPSRTYTFFVENGTGALFQHWGKEYML